MGEQEIWTAEVNADWFCFLGENILSSHPVCMAILPGRLDVGDEWVQQPRRFRFTSSVHCIVPPPLTISWLITSIQLQEGKSGKHHGAHTGDVYIILEVDTPSPRLLHDLLYKLKQSNWFWPFLQTLHVSDSMADTEDRRHSPRFADLSGNAMAPNIHIHVMTFLCCLTCCAKKALSDVSPNIYSFELVGSLHVRNRYHILSVL